MTIRLRHKGPGPAGGMDKSVSTTFITFPEFGSRHVSALLLMLKRCQQWAGPVHSTVGYRAPRSTDPEATLLPGL